jgi:hypothetical protein
MGSLTFGQRKKKQDKRENIHEMPFDSLMQKWCGTFFSLGSETLNEAQCQEPFMPSLCLIFLISLLI